MKHNREARIGPLLYNHLICKERESDRENKRKEEKESQPLQFSGERIVFPKNDAEVIRYSVKQN